MLKTFPKILIYFFLIVFILQLVSLLFLLLMPTPSQAVDFTPQITIDETFQKDKPYTIPDSTEAIGQYVRAIYKYAIGIVGILAAVVLMFGGVIWLTAGGNTERVSNAKAWIGASLTGLILALCSYMILATINPALVDFRITGIEPVKKKIPTPQNLSEGSICTPGQAPFCDYGLECKNGRCVKTAAAQQASQSGKYQWKEIGDCSTLGKINYGDTYCPSPKPGVNYNCCGKYE